MIIINKTYNIDNIDSNKIHVVTDFDRTLTYGKSHSSWAILSKSELVPKEYADERNALYNHYRPIELDNSIDHDTKCILLQEWWVKHINLLVKYKISEEVIKNAVADVGIMEFRDGAKEFLESLRNKGIPVIIISAGIGNFVEQFLRINDCYFDNIHVISNKIIFKDGYACGIEDNIVHTLNKNEVSLPEVIKSIIKDRNNVVLLGDSLGDLKMTNESNNDVTLKVGFLEESIDDNMDIYTNSFDIVCIDNENYLNLAKKIKFFG